MDYQTASANWRYEPDTGHLYWLKAKPKVSPSLRAGSVKQDGSVKVGLQGKRFFLHRIAWVLMTGDAAPAVIDHINGDPGDNRWLNLRAAGHVTNQANLNKKPCGVVARPYNRFEASIRVNGVKRHLGMFGDKSVAQEAYAKAHMDLHGEFSCFNRPAAV